MYDISAESSCQALITSVFFLKDQLHHSYSANGPNDFALSKI